MKFRPRFTAFSLTRMPHKNVDEACEVMLHYFPEVPSPPHLTQSVRVILEGAPCLVIDKEKRQISFDLSADRQSELVEFYDRYLSHDLDYFAISPERDPCLYRLAEMYKEKPWPELKLIHFYLDGPMALGLTTKDEKGAPAFYNDTMKDLIVKLLAMKARWLERKVKELFSGVPTMCTYGDPSFAVFTSSVGSGAWSDIKNAFNEVIEGLESITDIHCCSNFDWSLLMETNYDVINFDAYQHGETMALYPEVLHKFLERGGMIAWGIVPTFGGAIEDENPDSLVERMEHVLQLLIDRGVDKELLLESSWITPACATITMSIEQSNKVFSFTKEVSQRLRKKYFG